MCSSFSNMHLNYLVKAELSFIISSKAFKINSRGCQNDLTTVEVFLLLLLLLINKVSLNVFLE